MQEFILRLDLKEPAGSSEDRPLWSHWVEVKPERREQENNFMQGHSQGTSVSLSSNTHSGWASSYYSPPGALLHLPHSLTTTQSPLSRTLPTTSEIPR